MRWLCSIVQAAFIALGGSIGAPASGTPACHLSKYLELEIFLSSQRALVTTKIGGKDARFIVDSGAFYSTMSLAAATDYGLKPTPAPFGFRIRGVNGDASASIATVKEFIIGGVAVPRVEFLVGGTDTGSVGLLGQNFLGIGDVEYDCPTGRFGCCATRAARWTALPIGQLTSRSPRSRWSRETTLSGPYHWDGDVERRQVARRIRYRRTYFVLTMAAAKRAGVTPTSPGTIPGGSSAGIGTHVVSTWIGSFDKIEIGGEAIPKPKILFGDLTIDDGDMLIGLDFFRTHRIYVANKADRMLLTYEGGPVFGLVRAAREAPTVPSSTSAIMLRSRPLLKHTAAGGRSSPPTESSTPRWLTSITQWHWHPQSRAIFGSGRQPALPTNRCRSRPPTSTRRSTLMARNRKQG